LGRKAEDAFWSGARLGDVLGTRAVASMPFRPAQPGEGVRRRTRTDFLAHRWRAVGRERRERRGAVAHRRRRSSPGGWPQATARAAESPSWPLRDTGQRSPMP